MRLVKNFRNFIIDYSIFLYFVYAIAYLASWNLSKYVYIGIPIILAGVTPQFARTLGQLKIAKIVKFSRFWQLEIILIFFVSMAIGWQMVEIDVYDLFAKSGNALIILKKLFHPNMANWRPVMSALIQTLYLAFMATVFAIPFAFVLSFGAARNLMPRTKLGNTLYVLIRTITTFVRSIEAIVWAIIFTVWVGIGPLAGMLALLVHSIAALTKLYSEQIENINTGPLEAIRATGASWISVWIYAVIPQILAPFLAFTIYRWDINIRMATIVGFVGGGGIGLLLKQQQDMLRWHDVGLIVLLIALLVWIMDMLSAKLRAYLMD